MAIMERKTLEEIAMIEFIKMVGCATFIENHIGVSFKPTANRFIEIINNPTVTEYSFLIDRFRKYCNTLNLDNFEKVLQAIDEIWVNLPKCTYEVFPAGVGRSYIIYDKDKNMIYPDELVDFLNDNNYGDK